MTIPKEVRREVESTLENMSVNRDHFNMLIANQSNMFYKRYRSLIEVDFSEEQAFELVKHRGLS